MNYPPRFRNPQSPIRNGFTLVELLVTISIIAILIGLTVMGVSKIRRAAWATNTQNELMTIQNAIQEYYSAFHAYPGPIPNNFLSSSDRPIDPGIATNTTATGYDTTNLAVVTGPENLVLGLYGGLKNMAGVIQYDPSYVGQGPMSLNPLSPKKYTPYMSDSKLLSWRDGTDGKTGHYQDDAAAANDSIIPELVDRFPQGMPILYLRASAGYQAPGTPPANTMVTNNIITDQSTSRAGQYQLEQIAAYTRAKIGEQRQLISGRSYVPANPPYVHGLSTVDVNASMDKSNTNYKYPFNAYPYFKNSTLSTTNNPVPRKKDEYILISPGPDRIYGTEDDITNFGSVVE